MRASIFSLLRGSPNPLKPADVAKMLGETQGKVKMALLRMVKADPPLAVKSSGIFGAYEAAPERGWKF
jgi:hypothetical protein